MQFQQAFPIAIIDEDYESKSAAGRGMRQLAAAIELEGEAAGRARVALRDQLLEVRTDGHERRSGRRQRMVDGAAERGQVGGPCWDAGLRRPRARRGRRRLRSHSRSCDAPGRRDSRRAQRQQRRHDGRVEEPPDAKRDGRDNDGQADSNVATVSITVAPASSLTTVTASDASRMPAANAKRDDMTAPRGARGAPTAQGETDATPACVRMIPRAPWRPRRGPMNAPRRPGLRRAGHLPLRAKETTP